MEDTLRGPYDFVPTNSPSGMGISGVSQEATSPNEKIQKSLEVLDVSISGLGDMLGALAVKLQPVLDLRTPYEERGKLTDSPKSGNVNDRILEANGLIREYVRVVREITNRLEV